MPEGVIDRIESQNQAGQQHALVGPRQVEPVDLVADGIEFAGVVQLKRAMAFGAFSAIVLRKPAVVAVEAVELVNEILIKRVGLVGHEVTVAKHFRPHGHIVASGVVAALRKGLRHPRGAGKGIEHFAHGQ